MPLGEHFLIDQRLKFRQILEQAPIKALHVTNGMFIEFYLHWNQNRFCYWGSADQEMDLISMWDAAKYLAAALSRPDRDGELKISGNEIWMSEIVTIYNLVFGTNFHAAREGSIDDLKKRIAELKKYNKLLAAVELGYMLPIFDGRGKILKKNNDEFPDIKPIDLETYLKEWYGKTPYRYSVEKAVNISIPEIQSYG